MRYFIDVDPRLNQIESPQELIAAPEAVWLLGQIDEDNAAEFRRAIEVAEHHALRAGQKILPVCIDSYGGDIYATWSIIDALDACSIPIATIAEGKAMSAAAAILTCGVKGHRYMGPNATVMIHDASMEVGGTAEHIQSESEEIKRLIDAMFKRMDKNCDKKGPYFSKFVKEHAGRDNYLTPKQCKKMGLINHIGIPTMRTTISVEHEFGL